MEVPPQEINKQTKPAWVILGMNLKRDQKETLLGAAVGRVLINCCKIYRRRVSGAPPGIAPTVTQRKRPCRGLGAWIFSNILACVLAFSLFWYQNHNTAPTDSKPIQILQNSQKLNDSCSDNR